MQVLFATETFAMGVNMPARTVVFNGAYSKAHTTVCGAEEDHNRRWLWCGNRAAQARRPQLP